MEDLIAIKGIRDILEETWVQSGFAVPIYVTEYIARILADKLDKNPWQPEPSYAERYMTLKSPTEALALGNTCFFTRSVFPDLGRRRGINASYYVQIGQGCYDRVLSHTTIPAIRVINQHFEYCAEMTWTAVHSKGGVREFWDL